ncbi:MAG: saccharopine dehydrogenase C-terminal domain-containing protein [Gemmatimonadota bacterium]|nr:saccharopine dehydrogenase C-terminal domain-containing protein [Gemmatimonadota bacterium]
MSGRLAVVLGAGRVGGLIARTLADEPALAVRAVDRSDRALAGLGDRVEARAADLSDAGLVQPLVEGADVALLSMPGAIGFELLRALVDHGIPTVDVSFSPEDPRALDPVARERGIPVIVDCGVAPGLSNLMVGRSVSGLDEVESVRILVGGIPSDPRPPWGYRAVFHPADVLEEYVRPARIRLDGEVLVRPALSGIETVEVEGVGTLEAFLTDGLRTLLDTIPAATMIEKTLRWPGHAAKMRALRDSGFLNEGQIEVGAVEVAPRAVSERLLKRAWALRPGEEELTVLRVEVEGEREGERVRDTWTLFDRTDPETNDTSMARATGFPAVAVARAVTEGAWMKPGVHPPETLGAEPDLADRILEEIRGRGVRIEVRSERL